MAKSAKYYNVDDFNDYKRKQGRYLPPRTNILAAACHVQALFDAKKFTWGFMGGLAMLCLGYKREMPDLHIAYDDKDFERLKSKLESDQRIRLPNGVNPLLPFKVLVWTGPEYKDQGCTVNASVELDLIPSGSCGSPAPGALIKNLVLLGLKASDGQQRTFKCLNIQFLTATLLSYCKARDLLWDPRKDILYLCKTRQVELQHFRAQLNTKEVKELFLGTSFFSRLRIEDQRLCYRLLLDTEPPPIMAITPPAPQVLKPDHHEPLKPEQNDDPRTSRSRYRNVSGQRSSSSATADHRFVNGARPQSTDHLQDPRWLSHIIGIQSVNAANPQSVSAASAARRARKSMPNLMAAHNTASTFHASPQNIKTTTTQQQHQITPRVSHVPGQSTLTGSHQNYASSQLEYGGSFHPELMRFGRETEDDNQSLSLGQGTLTNRSDSTKTDSTGTSILGIRSQKGSLHMVSPEGEDSSRLQYFQDESVPPRGRLHLVGPEGVYGAPEKPQHTAPPQAQHRRHQSAPPPQTELAVVFELDVTAPSKPTVIAELPANNIVPSPAEQRIAQQQTSSDGQATIRPLNPRTTTAHVELGSLPASLIAGGPGMHVHHQSLSYPQSSDEPMFGFSTHQTNAYRYSSYMYSQPADSGIHLSPEKTTNSSYKAYRPSAMVEELRGIDRLEHANGSGHARSVSNDSTASHDSSKLAKEYQELLNFEEGYGSH